MSRTAPTLNYGLAVPTDDAALRRLLQENAIPGNVTVTFEREPSYFIARQIEGPFHQTLVARHPATGQVLGIADRSVRDLYVNGTVQPVGYMSQLRVDAAYIWGLSLARAIAGGFDFFHKLHADARTPYYLMSVTADNDPAHRLFTSKLKGMPQLTPYTRYRTYAISLGRPRPALPLPKGLTLTRATAAHMAGLVECLQRQGQRYQFSPHWTAETLFQTDSTPGLCPENVHLISEGERVVGCLAVWDQSRFKQTIVRGYAGLLKHWRRLFNLAARVVGWPPLPDPHSPIRQCFASHLAAEADDPVLFAALLRAAYTDARQRGFSYLILGLAENHPFRSSVESYWHILYHSLIYLVAWEDGQAPIASIDKRPAGIEAAVL